MHPSRLLATALLLLLAAGTTPAWAADAAKPKPAAAQPLQQPPADLTPDKVDAFVAPLSDAQARRLLLERLREQATARTASVDETEGGASFLAGLRDRVRQVGQKLAASRDAAAEWRDAGEVVLRNLTDDKGWLAVGRAVLVLVLMLGGAAAAEYGMARLIGPLPAPHAEAAQTYLARLPAATVRLMIRLVRLVAFAVVAFGLSFAFYETFHPLRELLLAALAWVMAIRLWAAISRSLLAPATPAARLLPIGDRTARNLHRDGAVLVGWASFMFFGIGLLKLLGLDPPLLDLLGILGGLVLVLLLIGHLWLARDEILRGLFDGGSRLVHALAQSWMPLVTGYLLIAWAFWAINLLQGDRTGAAAAVKSGAILLAVPLIDRLSTLVFTRVLHGAATSLLAMARRVAQAVVRLVLLTAVAVLLVEAWGGELFAPFASPIGAVIARATFSVAVALLLTWVAWEAITHWIDRRLAAEPANMADGSVSRAHTLLPLLRRLVLATLAVMVTLIVLSSIGIDIGPLLAGAGIVGLAIGFGAQTLVRDIVSGLFFLVDDAFRVGEYVDLGRLRGTVERITVRALVLRHHRGALHTVPFGQIQAITNYNRDWLIEKIELRLPYDTDVDRVKRLIKQVGKELSEDPELGPNIIETLKSQGLTRFESGYVVIRAKFMCKPREQFTVRREALKRIKQVFADNGIRIAAPAVIVHGPPEGAAALLALEADKAKEAAD